MNQLNRHKAILLYMNKIKIEFWRLTSESLTFLIRIDLTDGTDDKGKHKAFSIGFLLVGIQSKTNKENLFCSLKPVSI